MSAPGASSASTTSGDAPFAFAEPLTVSAAESRLYSAVVDPHGRYAYFGTDRYTAPARVVKVDLVTFQRVGQVTLDPGERTLTSAVIDPAGQFAYFGTDTSPGRIVKIDLATFQRVDAITLPPGESGLRTAVIDADGQHAYFGTLTSPGRVVRIDLTTFERVDVLTLPTGDDRLFSAVRDPTGHFAYFGTVTAPGRVVKIDLDTFTHVETLPMQTGENALWSAVVDPSGGAAYFGTQTQPGRIVKIDLTTFQRVGGITLLDGENSLGTALMDPSGRHAYFGTDTSRGRVIRVDLDTFQRRDAVTLSPYEAFLRSAVMGIDGRMMYFGSTTQNLAKLVIGDLPDLVVSALADPPVSRLPGATFTVTDTTSNVGTADAAATRTRYYFSADLARNAGDVLLDGARVLPPLTTGQASTGSRHVTIPTSIELGTYHLIACADNGRQVVEGIERNNCTASPAPIVIGDRPPPDLVVTHVVDPPAWRLPGETVTVSDTTANTGRTTAASSRTRYYLSTDSLRNAGDWLLSGVRVVPALPSGTHNASTRTVTIPSTTPLGTYYLLACADDTERLAELDETNNCRHASTRMLIGTPPADLVTTAVADPPTSRLQGETFTAGDTTTSTGGATAPESRTRYYLSADQVRNTGDRLLTGARVVPTLSGGAAHVGTRTVTIPTTTTPGAYHVLACADDTALVPESDETNNCTASATTIEVVPLQPDLVVTAVDDPPSSALRGQSFTAGETTVNDGRAAAPVTQTRYRLSTDQVLDPADRLLSGARGVESLAVGASSTGTRSVIVPADMPSGTYHVLACADFFDAAAESDEGNNCSASTGTVTVGSP